MNCVQHDIRDKLEEHKDKQFAKDVFNLLNERPDILNVMESTMRHFHEIQERLNRRMLILDNLLHSDSCSYKNIQDYRRDYDETFRKHRYNSAKMNRFIKLMLNKSKQQSVLKFQSG